MISYPRSHLQFAFYHYSSLIRSSLNDEGSREQEVLSFLLMRCPDSSNVAFSRLQLVRGSYPLGLGQ